MTTIDRSWKTMLEKHVRYGLVPESALPESPRHGHAGIPAGGIEGVQMSTTTQSITVTQRSFRRVPLAPTVKVLRPSKYGLIPGLPDEEPADLEELERLAVSELFGPVLALKPCRPDDWKELARNWGGGQ